MKLSAKLGKNLKGSAELAEFLRSYLEKLIKKKILERVIEGNTKRIDSRLIMVYL